MKFFSTIIFKTMLLALLAPMILTAFDELYLQKLNSSALFSMISDAVPAVQRMSKISPFPEYVRAVECIEWLFVPIYFALWNLAMPFWTIRVRTRFTENYIRKNGRIQWQAIVGIIFFILLIFSDIFHLHFISFYTGVGMNDHVDGLLGRLMNGSKFSFGVAAWLLCVGEAYIYYLMVIAMYVATLRAKNIFFRSSIDRSSI